MPYHFPGYRYCGPGTDVKRSDKEGGPINDLDKCCREHDIALGRGDSQEKADSAFLHCANKEGVLGQAFGAAVQIKSYLGEYTGLGEYLPGKSAGGAIKPMHKYYRERKQPHKDGSGPAKRPNLRESEAGPSGLQNAAGETMEQDGEQQSGGGGKTGGSGGGGQVPPMNPRPIQTGTLTVHFSRTFRHYVATGQPNYASPFDQQWADIPYQHFCSSMKPRDWQMINVTSKRWRVLSCGFNIEHIIPVTNKTQSAGGTVGPDITINLMPYLETYIDKGYQLPPVLIYENHNDLPNASMSQNSGNQASAKLVAYKLTNSFQPDGGSNQYFNKYIKSRTAKQPLMDLMNSTEWGTCQPTQTFSFEWTPSNEDLVWRHALRPAHYQVNFSGAYQAANPYGRVDGGFYPVVPTDVSKSNMRLVNGLRQNPNKPAPTCLIRPVTIHDDQGNLIPIVFQILCKYHITIELDLNDISNLPIYNRALDPAPSATIPDDYFFNIYGQTQLAGYDAYYQWTGASSLGNFCTGPSPSGSAT